MHPLDIEIIRADLAEIFQIERRRDGDIDAKMLAEAFNISVSHAHTKMAEVVKLRPGQYDLMWISENGHRVKVLRPKV